MSAKQPKKIYRYQKFTTWAIGTLCHDQLHFAEPNSFNDPFDCQPSVESDSDRNTLRQILSKLINRRVEAETIASLKKARLEGEKASGYSKKMSKHAADAELKTTAYYATDPDYQCSVEEAECEILTRKIESELLQRYERGICCFSSTFSNPLLWSHYGDQHNGICIGYDLERDPKPILHKVEYGGTRIVKTSLIQKALLNNDVNANKQLDNNVLLRKAPAWHYEREWRLFGNRGVQDSTLALKDVTFGLRCPIAVMHSVIAALETRDEKIEFYGIYEVRGSFKLKRRLVDTGEMRAYLPNTAKSGVEIFGPFSKK